MRRLFLLSILACACGGNAPCAERACGEDASARDGGDPNAIVALRIEPASLAIELAEGDGGSGNFSAFFVEADGDERAAEDVEWSLGRRDLASIDASGHVSTDTDRGGESTVFASAGELSATATLVLRVTRTFGASDRFETLVTDASAAPILLYPLDGAVSPRNLRPPVVQWRPASGEGDVYRVRLETPHARVVAYLEGDEDSAWPVDEGAWRLLIESDPDAEIAIDVDRWQTSRERALAGASTVRMRVARGVVGGEVYYWALDRGRIYAVDPETATARDVVPSPPPQGDGHRCIACHTVSRDGRWLWGRRFDDDAGFVVDLAGDTTTDPPPMRYAPTSGIDTAAFDPSGDLLLAARGDGALFVADASSGLALESTGLPSSLASMPAWSPSGDLVAWIAASSVDANAPSSLVIADRDGLAFGAPRTLHEGSDAESAPEGGAVDALPSFTPDDRFLVFQHAPQAFTTGLVAPTSALHLVSTEGGAAQRLDALSEGHAFWPTVSPYLTTEANGRRYYWVAFHSRRDYGNALAGTWGRRTRQLWIAAVDADPEEGVDPSFVPVWLPGQEREIDNVAAYWAPEPCRAEGQSCVDDGECCGGACVDGPEGRTCAAPPG